MPNYDTKDNYRPQSPKLSERGLEKAVHDNTGRLTDQNRYVIRDKRENGPDKVEVIDGNGNRSDPLMDNVCRHCGSDLDDWGVNGMVGNAGRIVCPLCHAHLMIP